MKLIVGGAYQGKLRYAQKELGITDGWVDGRVCTAKEIAGCRGIHHFHEYIGRMFSEQEDLTALEQEARRFADRLFRENPEIVVVCAELGYGIVPMEKFERFRREMTGRVCVCLAEKADLVVRVVCGIGTPIKGVVPADPSDTGENCQNIDGHIL